MIKKFIPISIIIIIMSSLIIYGKNSMKYEVHNSITKIFFNDKEIKFNLPVVVINDYTYIPLREAAEIFNIKVNWSKDENKIMLSKNMSNFDIYKIFENLFKFKLSDEAEILYYNYSINKEQRLAAKISITKSDVEFIKNFVETNEKWEVFEKWGPPFLLLHMNKKFSWWDLIDTKETIFSYGNFSKGHKTIKSVINICLFITEESDNQYYLYALYQ